MDVTVETPAGHRGTTRKGKEGENLVKHETEIEAGVCDHWDEMNGKCHKPKTLKCEGYNEKSGMCEQIYTTD